MALATLAMVFASCEMVTIRAELGTGERFEMAAIKTASSRALSRLEIPITVATAATTMAAVRMVSDSVGWPSGAVLTTPARARSGRRGSTCSPAPGSRHRPTLAKKTAFFSIRILVLEDQPDYSHVLPVGKRPPSSRR